MKDYIVNEFIVGLYSIWDFQFIEGKFPVKITLSTEKQYELVSKKLVEIPYYVCQANLGLKTFYTDIKSELKMHKNCYQNENTLYVFNDFFGEFMKSYKFKKKSNEKIIYSSVGCYHSLCVKIDQKKSYLNSILGCKREDEDVNKIRRIFLNVVREFNNYHIIHQAPYHFNPDLHYRNNDGIFTFFYDPKEKFFTNGVSIRNLFTPIFDEKFKGEINKHFENNESLHIANIMISKSFTYENLENFSMAIIHAVIALESIIPTYFEKVLKNKKVDKKSIEEFSNKFGLNVRVKAGLKLLLSGEHHSNIDKVGTLIKYRNDIMHKGVVNSYFYDKKINELLKANLDLINHLALECGK